LTFRRRRADSVETFKLLKQRLFLLIMPAPGQSHPGSSTDAGHIPDECKTGGFALGCQAWTFHDFTLFEAIDKTAAAGGRVIELFPGQKLGPDKPRVAFDHNSSDDLIAAVKQRLQAGGIRAVNYGVAGVPNDEAAARKIFHFARKLGLYAITTESAGSVELIEKLVKEFDVRAGFHNHPRRPADAGYQMWDPHYILSVVKERDPRVGAAADVGHWARSGLDPVDCLKILEGRVISAHLKDVNAKSPDAHDVPFGTGVCDFPGILEELKRQKFAGNLSIEHEYNWANNVVDVAQCVGFVRGFSAR
jgi:sugar phosphate isomerase/epimerase